MHMVSKKDLNSAELEAMRTTKNSTTVMTAKGEVQTREEATEYVKQSDLFVKVVLLESTPAVFLGKSARVMGIHTTGPAVRNHISPKMARELVAPYPTMNHLWSWFISEFFLNYTFTYFIIINSTQDSVFDVTRYTENPVQERSGSASGELRDDPQGENSV